jgi:WXG100 family type VII secretion target
MSSPQIRADYDQLKTIQSTFNSQAEAIAGMNQNIKGCVETLKGGDWIGEGARAFYQEMDGQVVPSLTRLQRALAEAGRLTQQISQLMKQAEDESSSCFKI